MRQNMQSASTLIPTSMTVSATPPRRTNVGVDILGGTSGAGGRTLHEAKLKAQNTYNAAADFFDDPALGFWDRFGSATIDRLNLTPGASVLDVCAGTGASALPAAVQVGPSGKVVAVDLAENLLGLAKQKAQRRGLTNVEFRLSDVDALEYPPEDFDAVVCVFGIFFLPDMTSATTKLWRLIKPGGRLAITTWGPRLWEPASSLFWNAVNQVRPDLTRAYNPWDSLTEPDALRSLLAEAGASDVVVEPVDGTHPLRTRDDFWTIVLGSGYRATYEAMTPTERRAVHDDVMASIDARNIANIETNVVFALATKSV
jgi:ubiquinone/menaquinone biosynthesis C-methylase UbiE